MVSEIVENDILSKSSNDMSSYNELIALINGCINRNGVQAITGRVLNGVLRAMVNQLGAGYAMGGVAHPTDDPGTPEAPVCYYASEVGTYTHFGNIQIVPGELALLCFDLTDGWFKETMYEGFESVQATIDGNVGTPAVNVTYVNGVLSFDFSNMKGNTGAAAGFGNVTAAVDGTSGTPGVSVQTDGPDTAKNIAFQFTGLKGETGVTSVIATVDNTSGTPQCAVSLNGQQLTLAFTGLKGAQGDTGSSVAYPFTIVNNLTTNDATQALSAAMGVQLESEVSQLEAEVGDIYSDLTTAASFVPTWVDNVLLRDNGGTTTVASGGYFNRCSTTDAIPCSAYIGKNLTFAFGANGISMLGFYKSNNALIGTNVFKTQDTAGNTTLTVPVDAAYFRMGVVSSNSSTLAGMKEAAVASCVQVINPVTKSFVKGIFSNLDYVRELYIPTKTKAVSLITLRKANEVSGTSPQQYRSRVDITFKDGTSAYKDVTGILDEDEAKAVFDNIVTDGNEVFYILLSDQVPAGGVVDIYATDSFDAEATHNLNFSPSIKEYLDKAETDATISDIDDAVDEATEKADAVYSALFENYIFPKTWEDNKLLRNNGGITDITSGTYLDRCSTTQPIPCADYAGKSMTFAHGALNNDANYIAFYDVQSHLVGTEYSSYPGVGTETVTIPATAVNFRIGVVSPSSSGLADTKAAAVASVVVSKAMSAESTGKLYSPRLMGAMKYALPTDFDFAQILFFGQSFAQGGSSKTGTTGVIPNCYMFGDNVKALTGAAFNPLEQTGVEYPVVSCANALSQQYRRFGHDVKLVASTAGTGGVSITDLLTSYVPNVETMHTNMKTVADGQNKTVGCFAIVYMQGETDYREGEVNGKAAYKAYLTQVKNALQQSAMDNLGQTRKPMFFVYQTSGSNWIVEDGTADTEALGPSMAQMEFAAENDDVILVSPAYQVTTYQDGHPATNGERWLGEYYAKAIFQTLYRGFRYKNPVPMDYKVEAKKITIYVSDCVLPLMKNTWTLGQQTAYGFGVKADDVAVTIERVDLVDNAIILNLATDISSASSVKLSYGGIGVGKGNICDSDTWSTWLQYLSDSGDTGYDGIRVITQAPTAEGGGSLVGMDYPMNNFLCIFYKEITQ